MGDETRRARARRGRGPHSACARRGRGARLIGAFALVLALAASCPSVSLAETFGSISGTVTEASSSNPIGGIAVCAFSLNGELLSESEAENAFGCSETDASGAYVIGELRPESYAVIFFVSPSSELNFIAQLYDGKSLFGEEEPTPVSVPAGGVAAHIDARLSPGARISGRVTAAATGTPIEHAFVAAGSVAGGGFGIARTNANGEYTLGGLASGSYKVAFIAPGYEEQYFDHKAASAEATPVSVTVPGLTTGIDAALLPEVPKPPGEAPPTLGPEGEAAMPGGAPMGGPPAPKLRRPEGRLSVSGAHVSLRGNRLALVRLACAGRHACRAKVTLRTRRTIWVRHRKRIVSVDIGTSSVLTIAGAHRIAARVKLNAAGRRLLRADHGRIDAELRVVTPGRTREQRVVVSAAASSLPTGPRMTG